MEKKKPEKRRSQRSLHVMVINNVILKRRTRSSNVSKSQVREATALDRTAEASTCLKQLPPLNSFVPLLTIIVLGRVGVRFQLSCLQSIHKLPDPYD